MTDDYAGGPYLLNVTATMSGWDKPQEKLRQAFTNNEFVLYTQPIIKIGKGAEKRGHFEVFVRLQEEEKHQLQPGSFLPMLEHYCLCPTLDRYVVRKLLAHLRSLKPEQRSVAHLNLCNATLADPDFCDFVTAEIYATELLPELLCFEIPGRETNYPASAVALAENLKEIGCQISIGAMEDGEIPFGPLKELGANYLKLGSRLVNEIAVSEAVAAAVKTAAQACRSFDVQTIAQYVEDVPTLNALRRAEVGFAQGYGIGRPAPLEPSD
mgnify:CR=1 FL=1